MITLVFSPAWFYGIDIIFEILGVIVTMLIAFYSIKLYRFSGRENRSYLHLGLAFLAFAGSFLAKIATNFVLYYQRTVKSAMGDVIVKYNLLEKSNLFFQAGYDVHRFLMLLGLLGVYWLISKSQEREHLPLFSYLIFIVALFSFQTYLVFHLTAVVLLVYITKHYYNLCFCPQNRQKHMLHANLNFIAFFLILLSQISFMFVFANTAIYVVAESLQLAGFIIFLINLILLVFGHGKKKDKNRHHLRHP